MKITHVYPRWDKEQTPIGNGLTEADVWEELRTATLHDEGVLFIDTHQYAWEEFWEQMDKGRYVPELVHHLSLDPITKTLHIPQSGPYESKLVHANVEKVGPNAFRRKPDMVVAVEMVAAKPATTKEIVVERYLDLSTHKHARFIASKVGRNSLVVIWEPDVEAGDLDYLHELKSVDVVVFHRSCEKWGVLVEGDVDPENWEEEFPALADLQFEPAEVIVDDLLIKGNIHVDAGAFETYKTMGEIELASSILDGRPAFNQFKVNQRYPVLFLCEDMSPELFDQYSAPFNLRKHGSDFRVKHPKKLIEEIDSPVLQRAVKGRVLFLDTMLDFAHIEKAFESGEWIKFMQKLRTLITVHGCIAIRMTAHATKTGAKSSNIDPLEYLKDSVTFGGKIDVGFGWSRVDNPSLIFIKRIKGRGFKKPLSFTITINDDNGDSNLDNGRFPVYNKPGEAGSKEDHVAKDKGGARPNPKEKELAQQVKLFRDGGESWPVVANKLGLSESTVMRYYKKAFDANQGEATND